MGILPMIHGHDARATAKEYVNIYLGRNTRRREYYDLGQLINDIMLMIAI